MEMSVKCLSSPDVSQYWRTRCIQTWLPRAEFCRSVCLRKGAREMALRLETTETTSRLLGADPGDQIIKVVRRRVEEPWQLSLKLAVKEHVSTEGALVLSQRD